MSVAVPVLTALRHTHKLLILGTLGIEKALSGTRKLFSKALKTNGGPFFRRVHREDRCLHFTVDPLSYTMVIVNCLAFVDHLSRIAACFHCSLISGRRYIFSVH